MQKKKTYKQFINAFVYSKWITIQNTKSNTIICFTAYTIMTQLITDTRHSTQANRVAKWDAIVQSTKLEVWSSYAWQPIFVRTSITTFLHKIISKLYNHYENCTNMILITESLFIFLAG